MFSACNPGDSDAPNLMRYRFSASKSMTSQHTRQIQRIKPRSSLSLRKTRDIVLLPAKMLRVRTLSGFASRARGPAYTIPKLPLVQQCRLARYSSTQVKTQKPYSYAVAVAVALAVGIGGGLSLGWSNTLRGKETNGLPVKYASLAEMERVCLICDLSIFI